MARPNNQNAPCPAADIWQFVPFIYLICRRHRRSIFTFFAIGLGGLTIAALISFIAAAKQVRAWKDGVENCICEYTRANPWKLILENDIITLRCVSMIDAADWDHMIGIKIAPDFLEINTTDNFWTVPKSSMNEKEFDELVGYLQYQMKAKGWEDE